MDNTNPLSFIFNGSDPDVNAQLRQRIALAMLAKQKRFPKTFGEGLSAIGEAIGSNNMMDRLLAQDKADSVSARSILTPGAPASSAEAATTPAVTKTADATTPAPDEPAEPAAPTALARSAAPPMPAPGSLPPTGEPGNTGATTFPPPGGYPRLPVLDQKNFNSIDAAAPNAPPALARGVEPQVPSFDAPIGQYDPQSDPRRAIAMAMLRGGQPGQPQMSGFAPAAAAPPPPRPSVADFGQQPVLAPTPVQPAQPDPRAAVTEALTPKTPEQVTLNAPPPVEPLPQIRQAPPQQQIAQASPQVPAPSPGYVMPLPKPPQEPTQIPMTPRELFLREAISRNLNNPKVAEQAQNELSQLQAAREFKQTRAVEKYKDDLTAHRALELERQKQLQAAPKDFREAEQRKEEAAKAKDEASVRTQFANMDPKQIFTSMEESKKIAGAAKEGLVAANNARKAIEGGAITGLGADMRLNVAKLVTGMGLKDMGNDVANTETFRAAMAPVIASVMKATVGSQNISNTDREFAAAAAGGSIRLDATSIKRIIDIVGRASRETLEDHEKKVGVLFGQNPQGRALFGIDMPPVERGKPLISNEEKSQHDAAQQWLKDNPNDPRAPAVRKRLGM
jgi:hypothetical protein